VILTDSFLKIHVIWQDEKCKHSLMMT